MDSFPGGFPGVHEPVVPRVGTSNSANTASTTTRSEQESPLMAHLHLSLRHRRAAFKDDLISKLDFLTYVYIYIVYLYDCSLMMLILRVGAQMMTMIMQYSPVIRALIPKNSEKRSTFQYIIIVNALCALIHYSRDLPLPNDDGYIFGHLTLQSIGQKQLADKRWLYVFDTVLLYLQLLVFTSQYAPQKKEKHERAAANDLEFDGAQGNTVAMRLPFLSVVLPPFVSIDTLKTEDDEEREELGRRASQLDTLLGDGVDNALYGALEEADTPR